MNYLSLCAIVKNEDESYLREWLQYHHEIGFEHIFLYDNESRDPVEGTLSDISSERWLDIFRMPGAGVQLHAYTHCLHFFGRNSRWIGFIDLDEFIVPKTTSDVRLLLEDYEPYPALGINWLCFGSSGFDKKPGSSQVQHFIKRTPPSFPDNRHIKSIVQPERTISPLSPHHFLYTNNASCVNEHYQPVEGPFSEHSTDRAQINHYFVRSKEQFRKKISRGRATGYPKRKEDQFYRFDNAAVISDTTILDLWDPVNQKLKKQLEEKEYQKQSVQPAEGFIPPDQISPFQFDFQYLCTRTLQSMQKQYWKEAASILEIVLERYPDKPGGHILLSDLLLRTEKHQLALDCLASAEAFGIPSAELARQRGIILNVLEHFQEAQASFLEAHHHDPEDILTLIQLAKNTLDMGSPRMALRYLH